MYPVGIVGGGTSGLYLSYLLSKKGIKNVVFEEHEEIGKPIDCTGLVTERVLRDFPISRDIIKTNIDKATIHGPSGEGVTIRRKEMGCPIDRTKIEKELAEMAKSEGSTIKGGTAISKIKQNKKGFKLESESEEFECKLLIGADGAISLVGAYAKLTDDQEYVKGLEYRFPREEVGDSFDVYMDPKYSLNRFSWKINGKETQIGLLDKKNVKAMLDMLVEDLGYDPEEGELLGKFLPTKLLDKFVRGQIALVGDAAGHIYPFVGAGIYPGMRGSEILADKIKKVLEREDPRILKEYEREYRKSVGRDLQLEKKFEEIYPESKEGRNEIFKVVKREKEKIEESSEEYYTNTIKSLSLKSKLKLGLMWTKWKLKKIGKKF